MKLPSYSAEASLGRSSIAYTGAVGRADGSRETIIPASCAGVNCDWAGTTCFGSLDLDPFSCGAYYLCCQGAGTPRAQIVTPIHVIRVVLRTFVSLA